MSEAFVLLSGGIDSATCLSVAKRDHQKVTALSINYGQRHIRELESAEQLCSILDVAFVSLSIEGMPNTMLTDASISVPKISYGDIQGVSPMYVPFRNGQMLAKAAAYASANAEKAEIYIGAHAEDAANDAYPDCRLDFIGAMGAAIWIGTYHKVRVRAPLIEMTKQEIILLGTRLNTQYRYTWSCYKGGELHCGECATCRARKQGFISAGITDPTEYLV